MFEKMAIIITAHLRKKEITAKKSRHCQRFGFGSKHALVTLHM